MSEPKRHLVTAALPYANGPLHIGHIAGGYLSADIYVRYLRMLGKEVGFICGSDEHGAAITIRAMLEDTTPQAIVDRYHSINKKAFEDFGIEFDMYHRTSDPLHHKTSQEFFLQLNEKGAFTKKTSAQYFDTEKQQFLADRYITGECPNCSHPSAYGDQCENCGKALSPNDLINPKSTLSGSQPEMKETTHWFLPMNEHEDWLKEWLVEGTLDGQPHHDPSNWKKNVLGQCLSWIDGGLHPRAMTRDLNWGVPVPLEDGKGKVMYVWLDAPIGYISATKQWAENKGLNWEDFWKSEESNLVHFLGKDNIVFHAIIFPILLKTHGDFVLPTNVPANEFLNLEGEKLSTSRNHAVWLHEYLKDFPGKQDELRYVLTSIAPETKDSEFTWTDYQDRVNNELVSVLGNFVNRALVLTHKYFEGKVPANSGNADANKVEGRPLPELIAEAYQKAGKHLEAFEFRAALGEVMRLARAGNKFLADSEPWHLIKTDPVKTADILHHALQLTAHLAVVCKPFLPNTSDKMLTLLNLDGSNLGWGIDTYLLPDGNKVEKQELLFTKVEKETIQLQVEKLEANKKKNEAAQAANLTLAPLKDAINFDDFTKMDLRAGTIIAAQPVPKTSKLLEIRVDTGVDERTVVSGIAEHYKAEDIVGQQVTLLLNLEPRKIRGVESQGMILMAEDPDGKLCFVAPTASTLNGSVVR